MKWTTAKVERGAILSSVTATGTVEPVIEVEVGTQVSGIIDKIYVDYNSVVKKGQLLAEMDRVTLQAELASQEAKLNNAKAEYDYQQKNYARSKMLFEKKVVSDTDYETATYNYEKSKAAYEEAQAAMVKVRQNLGYATITSPIDGVVISRAVEAGQTVAAGFETPTLFTIANDLTQMRVIADVDEADIGQVAEGQKVKFTVDAYPNDVFEGQVTQVRLEATTESNVVTYEVVISAYNPDLKLKPGLTANITIYTLERNDVMRLPAKAFQFEPVLEAEGEAGMRPGELPVVTDSTRIVWTKTGDKIDYTVVAIGATNGIYTEVKSGLREGDEVVTAESFVAESGPEPAGGEKSPFMPQPPHANKKKKQ